MKLTKRGRDYFKAVIILALISSVFDVKSLIALAFTLSIAALISAFVLSSVSLKATKFTVSPMQTRIFKGEELPLRISIAFKRARWVSMHLSEAKLPEGIIVKSLPPPSDAQRREGLISLVLKSPYAGLFSGLELKLELWDTLGLFSKEIYSVQSPFQLESLPLSILSEVRIVRALPLSVGERSARAKGSSLELYALDEYQPFSDTKNLLWKKIARMPDEKLIVRVREAMIPKIVKIGIVNSALRNSQTNLRFMDLACEGTGALCANFFAIGSSIEILSLGKKDDGEVLSSEVSNIDEMADALMNCFREKGTKKHDQGIFELISRSDLVVCGLLELRDEALASAISRKPSLLISEEEDAAKKNAAVGRDVLIFSGQEDVRKLVSKVIEK